MNNRTHRKILFGGLYVRLSQTDKIFWLSGLDVSQNSAECRYDLKKEIYQKRCSTYFAGSIFVSEICSGLKAFFLHLLTLFCKSLGSERILNFFKIWILSDPKLLQKRVNKCKKTAFKEELISVTKIEPAKHVEHLFWYVSFFNHIYILRSFAKSRDLIVKKFCPFERV